jgi:uncharacterized protein
MILCLSCLILVAAAAQGQANPAAQATPPPSAAVPSSVPSAGDISQLKSRAEAGDANAQTLLGKAYRDGKGAPHNDELAAKWFLKAADQGDAAAQNSLGVLYQMGEGVPRDREEAVRWYRKAAKQGYAGAMYNLGVCYYNGNGVTVDDTKSYAWFLLAQEAGDRQAAEAVDRAGSLKTSTREAFALAGQMYEKGDELQPSTAQASKWYRKAADEGDGAASIRVASILLAHDSNASQEEYAEARRRCESIAKRYAPAAYCMAVIYRKGLGLASDQAETVKWLNRAADLGSGRAAVELGEAYWKGYGVPRELVSAYMWIWIAFNSKIAGADKDEQALRDEMSSQDVEQAKKKALYWSRTHHSPGLRNSRADSSSPPTN